MRAQKITVASLTLAGLCAALGGQALAQTQPSQAAPAPTGGQPAAQPAYPDQQYQQQPYQQQPYQQQPYQQQPYQQQPYQPQPYQQQPYYQGQPYPYQPQPYYQGQPTYVQPQRTVVRYVTRPRIGLIVAGAVTLGTSWLITSAAAATNATYDAYSVTINGSGSGSGDFGYASQLWPLYIPVLGPWIEMGYLSGSGAPTGAALLAFDGLVQAGGLAMIIGGAVSRTRVAIYAENGKKATDLWFSPLAGASTGLTVGGRF
jgi:hypothetical protein